jgi:hypothetical protein
MTNRKQASIEAHIPFRMEPEAKNDHRAAILVLTRIPNPLHVEGGE